MKLLFICLLSFACTQKGYSQSGMLDPSFGQKGIVTTDVDSLYDYYNYASQVLIGPDSKMYIVVSGAGVNVVSRRLANGSIDSSYGQNGYSNHIGFYEAVGAFQADGKIVFAGGDRSYYNGVRRINADGTQDVSFGDNGLRSTNFYTNAVAIQNDGKIVVVGGGGGAGDGFSVARYNQDGNIDSTFGGTGQIKTGFAYKIPPERGQEDSTQVYGGVPYAVTLQGDGKIVVGGTGGKEDYGVVFAIARYNIDGSLDSTFDYDGMQTAIIGNGQDIGHTLAILDDGKIVIGGTGYNNGQTHLVIARYNTDGNLDNSFNGNGKQVGSVFNTNYQSRSSLVVQKDKKIVIAGYALYGTANDLVTDRFNEDGTPDNSFGLNGVVLTDVASSDDVAASLVLQGDKVVSAGYSYIGNQAVFAIIRYDDFGSLDSSFDNDGILLGNFKQGSTQFNATAVQSDGKLVVVGKSWNGVDDDFVILRYDQRGKLDGTFNNDGKQTLDFGQFDEAVGVSIQSDGKIIVAGNSDNRRDQSKIGLARFNIDGSIDSSFNTIGLITTQFLTAGYCSGMTLQEDNKIVLVATTSADPYFDSTSLTVLRFNSNGTPDTSFADDGVKKTTFDSYHNNGISVATQDSGKILVLGRSYINGTDNFILARYLVDGSIDSTFSDDVIQSNVFGSDGYSPSSLTIEKDNKIVVVGASPSIALKNNSFLIARYTGDGHIDSTFNTTGIRTTNVGPGNSYALTVAINYDGRIVAGGTNDNFALALYKQNGSIDSSFGDNGTTTSQVGISTSSIRDVAFWRDKLYAIGSGQFPGTLGTIARYILNPEAAPIPNFISSANGDWNDPSTWIDGIVPNESSPVIVRNAVTISGEATCFSLVVEAPDGFVTVLAGAHLTITH